MTVPKSMGPDDLRAVSALLDAALDLPPHERKAWLAALPIVATPYRETLREMLERAEVGTAAGLIGQLPAIDGESIDPLDDLAVGQLINGYRLVRLIGRGGMGVVWLAERTDGLVGRQVALKLPVVAMPHRMLLQRFARERNILAALAHPHIARLYDAGVSESGQPYLVMEYVQGQPITDYCNERKLSLTERLRLFDQVLAAMQHAHANLVVHRDIKPANILVSEAGEVRLLDFGIAKLLGTDDTTPPELRTELTRQSGSPLTLDYASPEQIRLEPVGTASDIYSLGVLLYELASGERPYRLRGASAAQVEAAVLNEARKAPSLSVSDDAASHFGSKRNVLAKQLRGDLDTVILKALKPLAAERYASADAFAADLQRWRDGEPVRARPASRWYRTVRFVSRNKLAVGLSGMVALSFVVGSGVALWQAQVARTQTQAALATESFLTDLFRANSVEQSDPLKAQQTTARDLLDRGSKRVLEALDEAPEAKLRILKTLASLNEDLALYDPALALRQRRLELFRKVHPNSRADLVTDLLDTGSAALSSSAGVMQAGTYLQEAEKILDAMGDNTSILRGRLEVVWAYQMESDNCGAAKHATRGVELLRPLGPSDELIDGLLQLTGNLSFCSQAEQALAAGTEAIDLIQKRGIKSKLPRAYAELGRAYVALGKIDLGISNARLALDAVQALHPVNATPDSDTLNMGATLALKLVGFAHPVEALAVVQPLTSRALADLDHTDRDGLVTVLIHQSSANLAIGNLTAAEKSIRQANGLLNTFDAEDGQRVMVMDGMARVMTAANQIDEARRALDGAAQLHVKLHHTGTGQANEHVALRVLLYLRKGDHVQAEKELSAFMFKPSSSGIVSRPQIEHDVLQAEVALALRRWQECIDGSIRVHDAVAHHPLPEYVRDLQARAWQAQGQAQKALGQTQNSRNALHEAAIIRAAMLARPA
ncbi:MAG: serine/threonine protein kinase [Candidatus Saccharibacteria bacterium]|nr:serine/threonine protein kinase [Rhodoferax sp.]